ncbi:hypothetical protein BN1013_01718 [Candidatus Rubidus massiliensis]|nr:hypothetical protein BN1013_01718 [Candidatus Rubidus massiliensis]
MLKFNHKTMIFISGIIWVTIGIFLLQLGLTFILQCDQTSDKMDHLHILPFFAKQMKDVKEAKFLLVMLAIVLGYIKGKLALRRTAKKAVKRIHTFSEPMSIFNLYSKANCILIMGMILLGMSMKWIGLSLDVRGFIDVAVGCALVNASSIYFRNVGTLTVKTANN